MVAKQKEGDAELVVRPKLRDIKCFYFVVLNARLISENAILLLKSSILFHFQSTDVQLDRPHISVFCLLCLHNHTHCQ